MIKYPIENRNNDYWITQSIGTQREDYLMKLLAFTEDIS